MTMVLFIHSAGAQGPGEGSNALLAGLRDALPPGLVLRAPEMPRPDAPEAPLWQAALKAEIADLETNFILVGHSLGGSTILQTLAVAGMPEKLLGVVTLAAPFWGASGWEADYALPADADEHLKALRHLIILQGDKDEVVPADHPERYGALLPAARIEILPGVDHEGKSAVPAVVAAINSITAA